MPEQITVVITSCGRLDLLERTISSFLAYNSYPIASYVIVEDSGDLHVESFLRERYGGSFNILFNEQHLGQIASIDHAYATVATPYIFHCEDDWVFHRSRFLEESLSVLSVDPQIVTVSLRDLWDTNGHPPERPRYLTPDGVCFRHMSRHYVSPRGFIWRGFSFNPGLRRTADYQRVGSYAAVLKERGMDSCFEGLPQESAIGECYHHLDYYAAILEQGAVEHIGYGRHVSTQASPRTRSSWFQPGSETVITATATASQLQEANAKIAESKKPLTCAAPRIPLFAFTTDDRGHLVGALLGITHVSVLHISVLWVADCPTQDKILAELFSKTEAEAIRRGCNEAFAAAVRPECSSMLNQFGYTSVSEISNFKGESPRAFLRKRFAHDKVSGFSRHRFSEE